MQSSREYWRSLDELAQTPEFQQRVNDEFPGFTEGLLDGPPATRRGFLKIMGASLALAGVGGLTGCIRWPAEKIVPFARRGQGHTPGEPIFYSTSMDLGGFARPLQATSYDGRPVKVDGNSQHPVSRGKSDSFAQASVLDLYDPSRVRGVEHDGNVMSVADAVAGGLGQVLAQMRANPSSVAIVHEANSSPTFARLKQSLSNYKWFEYEPLSRDNAMRGSAMAFKNSHRVVPRLSSENAQTQEVTVHAEVILSVDSDFLMNDPNAVQWNRDFARSRRGFSKLSQLHVLEGGLSVTGGRADERYPVRPSRIAAVLGHVAHLLKAKGIALNIDTSGFAQLASDIPASVQRKLPALAAALHSHQGKSLLLCGPSQPAAVHAMVHALNAALGNNGKTVNYIREQRDNATTHAQGIAQLATQVGGAIKHVVVLGGNPIYSAPADVALTAALAKATQCVHVTERRNETSECCKWVIPRSHFLESWGDGRSYDGHYTLAQPLIAPLFGSVSDIEFLATLGDMKSPDGTLLGGYDLVRSTFSGSSKINEDEWETAIHDGFRAGTQASQVTPALQNNWGGEFAKLAAATPLTSGSQVELVLPQDHSVYDGRYYSNTWLQELPDPITKLCWDNAAIMSLATATKLNVARVEKRQSQSDYPMVKLEINGKSVELAAYVVPGHADDCVTVPLGYRTPSDNEFAIASYNKFSAGGGFNSYQLRNSAAMAGGVALASISKASGEYSLCTTQDHHAIQTDAEGHASVPAAEEQRRVKENLVRTFEPGDDIATELAHMDDVYTREDKPALWNNQDHLGPDNTGYRWGMVIDLSTCTGCSACITACQAENNIAVVGKAEAAYGREMHWLRVDRYFSVKANGEAHSEPANAGDDHGHDHDDHGAHGEEHGGYHYRSLDDPERVQVVNQPMPCQQCENAPCEQVCPVGATMHSEDGLNDMVYNRCIGTRYCSNNCPYKVRRFNYFNNYKHIDDVERMVYNPEVTIRNRGVMEKCTYCVQRISSAKIKARNSGEKIADVVTACAQACPAEAIYFGDLNDPTSVVAQKKQDPRNYTILNGLNAKPRTSYLANLSKPMNGGHG